MNEPDVSWIGYLSLFHRQFMWSNLDWLLLLLEYLGKAAIFGIVKHAKDQNKELKIDVKYHVTQAIYQACLVDTGTFCYKVRSAK